MYKDDYISAFGKLAPSEEWMTDTLAKTENCHNCHNCHAFWG